jgi:RNA polymerase sigma factor (sigma-70 family)
VAGPSDVSQRRAVEELAAAHHPQHRDLGSPQAPRHPTGPARPARSSGPAHLSVEARVEDRVSIGAFEDALRQLDDLSRSVVVLREVEGMSYEEISQVLDVPLPTVKTRLLRARRLLATALEGWKP